MIQEQRERFNRDFTQARYDGLLQNLQTRVGGEVPFRIAESPIFLPAPLLAQMQRASEGIVQQLSANRAGYRQHIARLIPPSALVPGQSDHPLFLVFDYALAQAEGGAVVPLLTEFQGFPSLLAFQYELSMLFQQHYRLDPSLRFLADGLDPDAFVRLFRAAILGSQAPENVVLMDVYPWRQGTWPDFTLTQRLVPGLEVVCATEVKKRGRRLFHVQGGREIEIRRIFNRAIWEELEACAPSMAFRMQDDLDVEWAGHPDWFFEYSKVALPYLRHPNVPRAFFLDQVDTPPGDLRDYVLKPLFSFSGRGLVLDLDAATLASVPAAQRPLFLLQEKFQYADVIRALEGSVRCEVRLMYIWTDRLTCVSTLPRMSRGRIMGCAYNRTEPWTGHGVAFFP